MDSKKERKYKTYESFLAKQRERYHERVKIPGYRERLRAQHNEYRKRNRDKIKVTRQAWRDKNRDHLRDYIKKWRATKAALVKASIKELENAAIYPEVVAVVRLQTAEDTKTVTTVEQLV